MWLDTQITQQRKEAQRRRSAYMDGRTRRLATDHCAIVVDDGMATGLSFKAALKVIRADKPSRLIVAVPVAPREKVPYLKDLCDDFIAVLLTDSYPGLVEGAYENFDQLDDGRVVEELARVPHLRPGFLDDKY